MNKEQSKYITIEQKIDKIYKHQRIEDWSIIDKQNKSNELKGKDLQIINENWSINFKEKKYLKKDTENSQEINNKEENENDSNYEIPHLKDVKVDLIYQLMKRRKFEKWKNISKKRYKEMNIIYKERKRKITYEYLYDELYEESVYGFNFQIISSKENLKTSYNEEIDVIINDRFSLSNEIKNKKLEKVSTDIYKNKNKDDNIIKHKESLFEIKKDNVKDIDDRKKKNIFNQLNISHIQHFEITFDKPKINYENKIKHEEIIILKNPKEINKIKIQNNNIKNYLEKVDELTFLNNKQEIKKKYEIEKGNRFSMIKNIEKKEKEKEMKKSKEGIEK